MKTIDEHIQKDESELKEAKAQGNESKLHHLEDELNSLKNIRSIILKTNTIQMHWNFSVMQIQMNQNAWFTTIRIKKRSG